MNYELIYNKLLSDKTKEKIEEQNKKIDEMVKKIESLNGDKKAIEKEISIYSDNLFDDLCKIFESYCDDDKAIEQLKTVYNYASFLHANQKRDSGEPYIAHPLNVAIILAEMHADKDTICAALLHDVIEDTYTSKEEIGQRINSTVSTLVDGVSKCEKIKIINNETKREEYMVDDKGRIMYKKLDEETFMRKLYRGFGNDKRIVILKLADKLHNMRTLEYKKKNDALENSDSQKKNKIKRAETSITARKYFIPLADLLGLYDLEKEMEDLALYFSSPATYNNISDNLNNSIINRKDSIIKIMQNLDECLNNQATPIKHSFDFYKKSINSIFENGHEKHDLISLQIILDNTDDCINVLKLINNLYESDKSLFKNYIKRPKVNGYQSIHISIKDENDELLQIQIRTKEMDEIAKYGVTYKWDSMQMERNLKYLMKAMHRIDCEIIDNDSYFKQIKKEIIDNQIIVYTPNGMPISLMKGSTLVDYAYLIHTELGNYLDYAIISEPISDDNDNNNDIYITDNRMIVKDPLYELKDGQIIQINTSPFIQIKAEWKDKVTTVGAKRQIRKTIRKIVKSAIDLGLYSGKVDEIIKNINDGELSIDEILKQVYACAINFQIDLKENSDINIIAKKIIETERKNLSIDSDKVYTK